MAKTDSSLTAALRDALERDYSWLPESAAFVPEHDFSKSFDRRMSRILAMAGCRYVTVGRRQLRRALVAALIAVMILAMAAGAVAVQRALVHWNESQNDDQGTLDVTFDIEDPNNLAGEFRYMKPETPEGYEVVVEEKYPELYFIEYSDGADHSILYFQHGSADNRTVSLDNENAEFTEIVINGIKGYAYSKNGTNSITWVEGAVLYDISGNCTMKILEEMVRTITYKK